MNLQNAKGTQDVPPEEKALKNQLAESLQKIFSLYGFYPLETPLIERYETLAAKFAAGEASDALKEIFKLKDQGDRDLGLRFDLTVPLARYIAMNPNLKMPFKRYEIGPVFRDGPIKAGRMRQFWQCDFDIIGSSSMVADAECLALFENGFDQLGIDVIIKVNNRKLLNGILEQAGITDKETAIVTIDKLDKIGEKGVTEELKTRGLNSKQIKAILTLINPQTSLQTLKEEITAEEGIEGLKELSELFQYIEKMNLKKIKFEASLARGLAYYTGTVFEVYAKESKITSSLGSGGRWDNMIGNFMGGNRVIPAVGGSFGLVPIVETLKEKGKISSGNLTKAYVIPINTINEDKVLLRDMVSGTETLLSTKDIIRKLKEG
ncbi:histidine--tRNA ligase [Candidatus Woesearchaeota archaeon]|nr:histidine--tRNA ligase [Candidatus Woesearchaeota archaeon]